MDAVISILGIIIPSAITLIGCMINNNMQRAKEQHAIEMRMQEINSNYDKSTALIKQDIANLTDKVQKHNNVIERLFIAEKQIAHLSDIQNMLDERVDKLEGDDRK